MKSSAENSEQAIKPSISVSEKPLVVAVQEESEVLQEDTPKKNLLTSSGIIGERKDGVSAISTNKEANKISI